MKPVIFFATDHAGFELKQKLVAFVRDVLGYEVIDCGATEYIESDDFTDFIAKAAREVSARPKDAKAIILGGSGQGEAMLANRFHNVRAAVYYGGDVRIVELSRTHNDANVLSLGARFLDIEEAKKAVLLWLNTAHVPVEKYERRILNTEMKSSEPQNLAAEPPSVPVVRTAARNNILKKSIVPSLPASSYEELLNLSRALRGVAEELQVDIVDGVFAPYISWPFTEADVHHSLMRLQSFTTDFDLEIDCMCVHPEIYLDTFVQLGATRVIIHAGSTEHYDQCIAHARTHEYRIGLAVLNTTSPVVLKTILPQFDFVQVMGIAKVGAQGQPFDVMTVRTVEHIRREYPDLEIAVDGAVNATTIPALLQAGANRFAPGSAVAKSSDPAASYTQLLGLIAP